MLTKHFEVFVKSIHKFVDKTLLKKADEYADENRLHNFYVLQELTGRPAPEVAVTLMLKNLVSFLDAMRNGEEMTVGFIREKLGDPLVYLHLIFALYAETVIDPAGAEGDWMEKESDTFFSGDMDSCVLCEDAAEKISRVL